ncbi:hypothetical protein HY771_00525 [Candidatus Uhrbacteria bacterium]|nr:hypothetical protein [Candidatus Uhrbacteria bacterium]
MSFFIRQFSATAVVMFLSAAPALAQNNAITEIQKGLTATNKEAGFGNTSLPVLVGGFIQVLLGVVGIIFLVLAVYAGVLWMTAGGDAKKVTSAKDILRNSLIGIIIIVAAYALTKFVVEQLVLAVASDASTP